MLRALHYLIMALYVVTPFVTLGWAIWRKQRWGRSAMLSGVLASCAAGVAMGTGMTVLYASVVQGHLRFAQVVLASYFGTSLLLLLKGFDWALRRGIHRMLRVEQSPTARPLAPRSWRAQAALGLRLIVLFGLVLPYAMAAVMTYRPKSGLHDDPMQQLGYSFEPVSFQSTDGVSLRGWWIPAILPERGKRAFPRMGRDTVVICHGLAANKSNQLVLASGFVPFGYNVLIFDFRAHGQSGGQLTTFGDFERRDVLGAVRWLRQNHADEAEKIFGVGTSLGAAALIAAATDPGEDGQAIQAVAVYGGYDSLRSLAKSVADTHFLWPLNWLTTHVSVPMASAQVGTNLNHFAPAELVRNLWPRPILVIHGTDDSIIPFDHGKSLFDAADQPKARLWIYQGDHNNVIESKPAAAAVREFFRTAAPVPVI